MALRGSFEQGYNKIFLFDPLSLNNIPDTCVGNVNRYEHSLCKNYRYEYLSIAT
jgi:hypothetical protein